MKVYLHHICLDLKKTALSSAHFCGSAMCSQMTLVSSPPRWGRDLLSPSSFASTAIDYYSRSTCYSACLLAISCRPLSCWLLLGFLLLPVHVPSTHSAEVYFAWSASSLSACIASHSYYTTVVLHRVLLFDSIS